MTDKYNFKLMKKHWLTNTHCIETVKKSGPVGELNPGPLDYYPFLFNYEIP